MDDQSKFDGDQHIVFSSTAMAVQEDGRKIVRGYALKWSDVGDRFGDGSWYVQFEKGAFANTLKDGNQSVAFLEQHDGMALASTKNGSLRLYEDDIGLAYEVHLNTEITQARDAYLRIKDGISDQISVGVRLSRANSQERKDDSGNLPVYVTVYKEVTSMYEISLVHDPVFKDTSAIAQNSRAASGELEDGTDADETRRVVAVSKAKMGLRSRRSGNIV